MTAAADRNVSIILNEFTVYTQVSELSHTQYATGRPACSWVLPEFLSEYCVTANQRGLKSDLESFSAVGGKVTPLVLAYSHFERVPSYKLLGIFTSHKSKGPLHLMITYVSFLTNSTLDKFLFITYDKYLLS